MTITQRVDALTLLEGGRKCALPPVPHSVKVELTARCDFKCFFCASSARLRKKGDMDRALYRRVVRDLRDAGVEELGLFYLGESFLCEWLTDAIRYAKEDCGFPYVFLTTNGRLATPQRVAACMLAGLDSLKFSFNFSDVAQFHDVTGVKSSQYMRIVENVKAARDVRDRVQKSTGHRCGLYASSILYEGAQQERMQRAVDGIVRYVDEHYWLPLYGQAGLTAGARGTRPVAGNTGRIGAQRQPLPCWSVFNAGYITHDGKLSACCFDHDGRFTMGDLTTTPFMEAWHSPAFQNLREAHLRQDVSGTACEKCIANE